MTGLINFIDDMKRLLEQDDTTLTDKDKFKLYVANIMVASFTRLIENPKLDITNLNYTHVLPKEKSNVIILYDIDEEQHKLDILEMDRISDEYMQEYDKIMNDKFIQYFEENDCIESEESIESCDDEFIS